MTPNVIDIAPAAYEAYVTQDRTAIEAFGFIHFAPVGKLVFVTYEARANTRRFRNTELLTIQGGVITDVEVYFGWSVPHAVPVGGFVAERKS